MALFAVVSNLSGGYEYDQKTLKESGLVLGDRVKVTDVSMGQSHTSIRLEGHNGGSFNSIYFRYEEENGDPVNIYEDARYNPYLRARY